MEKIIDFTSCEKNMRFYNGADSKIGIIYQGKNYMLKFPKNMRERKKNVELNTSYRNNVFSEYISCHIFQSLGIDTQNTLIGKYGEKIVVACEDFSENGYTLQEFSKFENSFCDTSTVVRNPEVNDIEEIINNHDRLFIKAEAIDRFWDTFVVDALLGNFDRHSGNWGYLVNEENRCMKLAPVYDCGACLYPELADKGIEFVLNKEEEIKRRVYNIPVSTLKFNGKRVNYYDFLVNNSTPNCDAALKRVYPNIDMKKIEGIIDETPLLSAERSKFLKIILHERKERILDKAYEKIVSKQKENKNTSLIYKNGNRGLGIYDRNNQFISPKIGTKKEMEEKFGSKIRDPYELLNKNR